MTITYSLQPIPMWYLADKVGKPLAGGYLATFSSLDYTQLNPVFKDSGGITVWTYNDIPNQGITGIQFAANGTQGPFYFTFDSDFTDALYYLEVYDSDGVLQWTIDKFGGPGGGGGGGGGTTTAFNLQNLVVNNVMWRNQIGSTPISTSTLMKVAPGAHSSFANNSANAAGLYTGPDIYFIKNNSSATDTIALLPFPQGATPFINDIAPVDFLEYHCTGAGSGEIIKCIQFPITSNVQNLTNEAVSFTIQAKGDKNISIRWLQFYGDGVSVTAPNTSPIVTCALTGSWQRFSSSALTVPDITGVTLGGCGNSALFIQVMMPLDQTCTIDFTKPSLYLGNFSPSITLTEDYQTYDTIDGVINAPRTGYITMGFDTAAPGGYVIMNDGTIGNTGSGATTRANQDTFPLYNLLYNNVIDAWAPVIGGRSGSAITDFLAGLPLTLTRQLGRAIASAGQGAGLVNNWALGQYSTGDGTHTQTLGELAAHTHTNTTTVTLGGQGHLQYTTLNGNQAGGANPYIRDVGSGASQANVNLAAAGTASGTVTIDSSGSSTPFSIIQPTSFMNVFIKL